MADAKLKRRLPSFARNVLQNPYFLRQQLAWALLSAIEGLFPDDFKKLLALAEQLRLEEVDGEFPPDAEDRYRSGVASWTLACGVSCDVVNHVAAHRAWGDRIEQGVAFGRTDALGNWVEPPSLPGVDPFDESREDFLRRAGRHYDDVAAFYKQDGAEGGPVKRQFEHFQWLAAHLVGRISFARIADGDNSFGLSASSDKTVSGECRRLAALLGITLPDSPGPRPGSEVRKAQSLRVSRRKAR